MCNIEYRILVMPSNCLKENLDQTVQEVVGRLNVWSKDSNYLKDKEKMKKSKLSVTQTC